MFDFEYDFDETNPNEVLKFINYIEREGKYYKGVIEIEGVIENSPSLSFINNICNVKCYEKLHGINEIKLKIETLNTLQLFNKNGERIEI